MLTYFAAHTLVAIVPALFITGAASEFLPQESVLRYLSRRHPQALSYGASAVAGTVFTINSSQVLTLFRMLYGAGANLGPAAALLYSGPAVNVLAMVLTARVLGWGFAFARVGGAIGLSLLIGLAMAGVWGRRQKPPLAEVRLDETPHEHHLWKRGFFFALLAGATVFALLQSWVRGFVPLAGVWGEVASWTPVGLCLGGVIAVSLCWFTREELRRWMSETWRAAKIILPRLAIGVFISGVVKVLIPAGWIAGLFGGRGLFKNLAAAGLGSVIYFATLTEVPITNTLVEMGMGHGPALAFLLAGPTLSLPNIFVLAKICGWGRTLTYAALVVVISAFAGWAFGAM